ncbi:hypothetical protein [Qipengyuania flava]|uniref:hypothetical protein n=1 Tax=Qipengyuania flava TaxID=192812 RepID=UPI001C62F536|nr:hypothetical protein [Qipengyuania flava]QYJ07020.1 hypothetical protein KUV82_13410 [Qipengyuania flava]
MTWKPLSSGVAAASLLVAVPASAQYMPHLDPNLYMLTTMNMAGGANTCMTGTAPPENEIAEARDPAPRLVQSYFDAAQSGGKLTGAFRDKKKASWTHAGRTVLYAEIDQQSDPLVAAGNRLDPEPLRFFRAGNFQSAQGQWSVLDASGAVAGVYDVVFKRQKGIWRIDALTVLGADETVAPAMQYCMEPGDVTEHKVEAAGNQIEFFEEQIAKSEEKLVRERERLAAAQEKLAGSPNRSSFRERVQREKQKVARREEKLEELRENLVDAREFQSDSNRDVAEIAAITGPARDALRFRGFELTTDREAAEEKAAEEAKAAAD